MSTSIPSSGFPETRWTRVLAAHGGDQPSPEAGQALAELCEAYWGPVNQFARRLGLPPEEADDLTQGFFHELLERQLLQRAQRERGRFRSFLLGAFKNHLAEHRRAAHRQKRGGGVVPCSLDAMLEGEGLPAAAPESDIERLFDRSWAVTVVERAMASLSDDYRKRGHAETFVRLEPRLGIADEDPGDSAVSASSGADRVALLRLRKRFREFLFSEVSHTVADSAEVEPEMRHLLCAFAAAVR
jgi:DNA-directed RNA polymerase specialized sigma24 family protein